MIPRTLFSDDDPIYEEYDDEEGHMILEEDIGFGKYIIKGTQDQSYFEGFYEDELITVGDDLDTVREALHNDMVNRLMSCVEQDIDDDIENYYYHDR